MSVDYSVNGHVATIVLNRPEAMNALDRETSAGIDECFSNLRQDDNVRVVIVTGAGDRAFCAGADLKKTMPPQESFAQLTFGRDSGNGGHLTTEKPIIAAINGIAYGGGLELAMHCDLRIAADTARLALTEVRVGSIPGGGGTQRLPRLVGMTNALMMLMTGEPIDAAEAYRIGLVNRVVPKERLLEESLAVAEKIAANAPLSVRAVKRLAYQGVNMTLEAGLESEQFTMGVLRDSKDRIEGRLAFQQKRKPVFKGE
ncbi:enoyl-CoA hydratase/isomerase family protein [Mesorhizobium sp. B3-1-3]|nr:enoyl-CoA hydratase/isomerase family protein [Mesorhizobium sp. B3-1-8]TPI63361.1 enoyl-CoA hydratase/isomerase family protein [Mesorhizobium sp. B3-1-3]